MEQFTGSKEKNGGYLKNGIAFLESGSWQELDINLKGEFMKQIVAVGGEPATGKTSMMRGVISRLGGDSAFKFFQYGLLRGMWNKKEKVLILGIYDEKTFAGTDRLSMAVINDAEKFMRENFKDFEDASMLFEGDRLFNKRFLDVCKEFAPTAIMVLECSEEIKAARHIKRNDTQSESWLRSRKTKLENLLLLFPEAQRFSNNNEIELAKNFFSVISLALRKELNG